ncbi:hypothetical protein HF086_007546 [Spodoptera exigua]|uniref:Uncharacterized protein n=1 Tax=Spodoptera exigua TaxID=7107 RepID=A0A922MTQ4_SPOEX|nr:hypothetical protein HF086_007546 [Spodoptera exigua]
MENDILDSLNDLGYEGPLTEEAAFAKALDGGPKSLDFTKLVHILAEEIKKLCNLEETVNMMNDPDESSSFLLELSSFLKELKCHMSSRLQTKEDRLLLLDYLISELMAARMVNVDGPKEKQGAGMEIVVWSDRLKTKKDIIQSTYRPKRETLKVKPDVKLADFLAARTSLLQVEKTSSASVPDRGGRPNEQQPPPPEMPSWQQRNAGGGGGGRGGRGGGGGGGNYNSNSNFNNSSSNFSNSGPSGGGGGQGGGGGGGGYKKPYQNNQGYQHNQGYQANQGYQSNQGYQGRGGYQNEHDDRDRRGRGGYRGGRR